MIDPEINELQEAVWEILHDRRELRGFNLDRLRRAYVDLRRAQIESEREQHEPSH